LEEALTALHLPIGGYAHAGPNQGDPIYAIDFQELRNQITAAWNSVQVSWLVTDQLGTQRMVFDQSGSLATVSRHDYLPFGEELGAGTGGRNTTQGYVGDNTRQHFTGYDRDSETGLDYAHARYYSSSEGRFSGPDIPFIDQVKGNPQSWNLYTYVGNKPLTYTDPFGLWKQTSCSSGNGMCWESDRKDDSYKTLAKILHVSAKSLAAHFQNEKITLGHGLDVSFFFANSTPVSQAQPTYLSIIVFPASAQAALHDIRSAFGHVAFNINGFVHSWELKGWNGKNDIWPLYQDYMKDNAWRSSWEFVLEDSNDPEWATRLADKIQDFKGDGNWPYTDIPYGYVHDNCGEPFARAINRTPGVPNIGGFAPVEINAYIIHSLRPYIKQALRHPRK